MSIYVALLRAVNVGGYGRLAMADFRKSLQSMGFRNIETYIQSGNAVFESTGASAEISASIAQSLEALTGAPVAVMVRTHDDLTRIIAKNPYAAEAAAEGGKVHALFLADKAASSANAGLKSIADKYPHRRDRFHLSGDTLYLHLPEGAADTKFTGPAMDRAFGGIPWTARNWNTVLKLHAMSKRTAS